MIEGKVKILFRDDLSGNFIKTREVSSTDFNPAVIKENDLVIFVDGLNRTRVLKNRWGNMGDVVPNGSFAFDYKNLSGETKLVDKLPNGTRVLHLGHSTPMILTDMTVKTVQEGYRLAVSENGLTERIPLGAKIFVLRGADDGIRELAANMLGYAAKNISFKNNKNG